MIVIAVHFMKHEIVIAMMGKAMISMIVTVAAINVIANATKLIIAVITVGFRYATTAFS